jgi:two-component system LytT family response regulator
MNFDDKKILIQTQTGSVLIALNDIIYCRGAGSYTELILASDRKILSSNLLKEFELILTLPNKKFFRLHRSFLVNIDHIMEFRSVSAKKVIMAGLIEIPVSHRKSKEFLRLMKGHYLHLS